MKLDFLIIWEFTSSFSVFPYFVSWWDPIKSCITHLFHPVKSWTNGQREKSYSSLSFFKTCISFLNPITFKWPLIINCFINKWTGCHSYSFSIMTHWISKFPSEKILLTSILLFFRLCIFYSRIRTVGLIMVTYASKSQWLVNSFKIQLVHT